MSIKISYELLRESRAVPFLDHPSVGGAIMASLLDAEALQTSLESFIPPWFTVISLGDIRLGYGWVSDTKDLVSKEMYIVERRVQEDLFSVRAIFLDGHGYPVKANANVLECGLSLREAVEAAKEYKTQLGNKFFVDIILDNI